MAIGEWCIPCDGEELVDEELWRVGGGRLLNEEELLDKEDELDRELVWPFALRYTTRTPFEPTKYCATKTDALKYCKESGSTLSFPKMSPKSRYTRSKALGMLRCAVAFSKRLLCVSTVGRKEMEPFGRACSKFVYHTGNCIICSVGAGCSLLLLS